MHMKSIVEMNVEAGLAEDLFEGDMRLTIAQAQNVLNGETPIRSKRQAITSAVDPLWRDATGNPYIPYTIDSNLSTN
jgi:hypothetical protein